MHFSPCRVRSESSSASSSKACREKLRRDRLNDKYCFLFSPFSISFYTSPTPDPSALYKAFLFYAWHEPIIGFWNWAPYWSLEGHPRQTRLLFWLMLSEWWISCVVKPRSWRTQIQASRRRSRNWRYVVKPRIMFLILFYIWNFRTIACQKLRSELAHLLSLCRQRRLNFVMRSRGWSQRKRSWSSNWRPWLHSLASCLPLLQFLPHLLLKAKLMATRWCLSLVTLGSPCGSSCHLLQLIHPRIMYSAHQLLKSATGIQYRRFGTSLYPKQVYYLVIVLVLCLVLSSFVTV